MILFVSNIYRHVCGSDNLASLGLKSHTHVTAGTLLPPVHQLRTFSKEQHGVEQLAERHVAVLIPVDDGEHLADE